VRCGCCHRVLSFALRVGQVEQTGFGGVDISNGSEVNNSLFQSALGEMACTDALTKKRGEGRGGAGANGSSTFVCAAEELGVGGVLRMAGR
jgi:hypothetical protein